MRRAFFGAATILGLCSCAGVMESQPQKQGAEFGARYSYSITATAGDSSSIVVSIDGQHDATAQSESTQGQQATTGAVDASGNGDSITPPLIP